MEQEDINLNPERQKEAKQYARIQRRYAILDMIVGGVFALLWLIFGWNITLRNSLVELSKNPIFLVAAYSVTFGAILMIIDFPLSFYTDFILPKRFNISTQSLKGWIVDQIKSLMIGIPIGLLILEIIYLILRSAPQIWWFWGALIMLLFNIIFTILAPVLLMPLFNKFVPLGDEHNDLVQRLLKLAEKSKTHFEGIYKFDMSQRTKSANAAITGLGKTRRIILGDTLIENFTTEEIETVMAHEIGHQVHRDIPLLILTSTILTMASFYLAGVVMNWGIEYFRLESLSDVAAMPLFILVMGLCGLFTMPLSNGFSRWREQMADNFALQITGKAKAFISAMRRLANQNLTDADPQSWVEFLFHSHPALSKRIAMANDYLEHHPQTPECE